MTTSSAGAPYASSTLAVDLTESIVRCAHGGSVAEWPTTVGYLDSTSTDPRQLVVGEPVARALGANPLSGVRLLPTLVDTAHVLINRRPHAVGDLLATLLVPALPAGSGGIAPPAGSGGIAPPAGGQELVITHPSSWGLPRAQVLRSAAAKLVNSCSLLPRAVALARALVNPPGQTAAVIEAQASSVDISVLGETGGDWTLLESRRLHAQTGVSLTEVGAAIARELSDLAREKFGSHDYSRVLDALIIDAPPRLAAAALARVKADNPAFTRVVEAPRDAALRGSTAQRRTRQPVRAPSAQSHQPPVEAVSSGTRPAGATLGGQPAGGSSPAQRREEPAPLHEGEHFPQSTLQLALTLGAPQPQYGQPPLPSSRTGEPVWQNSEGGLPLPEGHEPQAWPASSRTLDSAFPEDRKGPQPRTWAVVAAALVLVLMLGAGGFWYFGGEHVHTTASSAQPAVAPVITMQKIVVPAPTGEPLFSFEAPANWEQTLPGATTRSEAANTFAHPVIRVHDSSDEGAEVGISYKFDSASFSFQDVSEALEEQAAQSPDQFHNFQVAAQFGGKTVASYDQPDKDANWYVLTGKHQDSLVVVAVGCRKGARGAVCEDVVKTLSIAP